MNSESIGTVELARLTGYSARQIQRRAGFIKGAQKTGGGHFSFILNEELKAWIERNSLLPSDIGKPGRKRNLSLTGKINPILEPKRITQFISAVATHARVLVESGESSADKMIQFLNPGVGKGTSKRRTVGCDAFLRRLRAGGVIENRTDSANWETIFRLATLDK